MAKEWIVSEEDLGCDGAYFSYTEVVRCEDCKHFQHVIERIEPNTPNEREYEYWECSEFDNFGPDMDFFCAYGIPRDEGREDGLDSDSTLGGR